MSRALADLQNAFASALVDPVRLTPSSVLTGDAAVDTGRFAVYRNNVMVGLVDALHARFPVVQRLVGDEFFRAMARVYVAAHKPRTPLLTDYGDDFPDFVADFEPAGTVPYLGDVARLERAWSQSYNAPEAMPLSVEALAQCRPGQLMRTRLRLHPTVRLLRSPYPVASIWAAHQTDGEVRAPAAWDAEDVLLIRPYADVVVHRLPPGACPFIAALLAGSSVQAAAEDTGSDDFDAGMHLAGLMSLGAIIAVEGLPFQEITP